MLTRLGIILTLVLALLISIPPQGQAGPREKAGGGKDAVRAAPPLVKITPRPDGKFLLKPLSPPPPPRAVRLPLSEQDQKKKTSPPVSPASRKQPLATPQEIAHLVLQKVLHARYAWGASLETGPATDCSGFTRFIYRVCGIDLPHSSAEQSQMGRFVSRKIDFSKLHPGDLLFFRQGGRAVGHVGLYLGDGKMIHASDSWNGVIVSDLQQSYFKRNFVVAKRIFEKNSRPDFVGLGPAGRNPEGRACRLTSPPPLVRLLPAPLTNRLLKIFWPWKYHLPLDFS
jgi:cell wall-associated NlpC family hydrolase